MILIIIHSILRKLNYNWRNMNNFEKVKKFMQTFGQEIKINPTFPDDKIANLRLKLIEEELSELKVLRK